MGRSVAILVLSLIFANTGFAQEILDPNKVAPAYRNLAEKRREEIVRRIACSNKATKENVLKRDLAAYVNRCMDEVEKAQQAQTGAKATK